MKKDFTQLKHPLIQAFGLSLKALRKVESKKAAQAAKDLGVGESLYRLLESGSATLQPSKALDLIKAFPGTQLDFARLSTLLVIFQIIASDRPTTAKTTIKQASELAKISEEAEELFMILRPIWDELDRVSDARTIASKIEKNDIPRSLLIFLAQKTSPTEGMANLQWISKQIETTPPLFLDLAAKLIGGLNLHARLMNVDSVKDWETEHRSRIRSVYAFVESLDDVIKTCDEFDWDFLGDKTFRRLTLISWGEAGEEKRHQTKLKSLKDRILKTTTLEGKDDKLAARIDETLCLSFIENKAIIAEIEENLLAESSGQPWKHAWVYELSPEAKNLSEQYYVAIMDNRLPDLPANYECIHCSAKLTQKWADIVTKLETRDKEDTYVG